VYYSEGVGASISAVGHSTSWNPYLASRAEATSIFVTATRTVVKRLATSAAVPGAGAKS